MGISLDPIIKNFPAQSGIAVGSFLSFGTFYLGMGSSIAASHYNLSPNTCRLIGLFTTTGANALLSAASNNSPFDSCIKTVLVFTSVLAGGAYVVLPKVANLKASNISKTDSNELDYLKISLPAGLAAAVGLCMVSTAPIACAGGAAVAYLTGSYLSNKQTLKA